MAEFVIKHAGVPYRIKNVVNEKQARIKLENYLAKKKVEKKDRSQDQKTETKVSKK